jgi:hypothetical protein
MSPLTVDLAATAQSLQRDAATVVSAHAASGARAGSTPPPLVAESLDTLCRVLLRHEADAAAGSPPLSPDELSELCEQGLMLLGELAEAARTLGLGELHGRILAHALPLALWVARQGGELRMLEPVVDRLAALANQTQEATELRAIYAAAGEVMAASAAPIRQDLDKSPGRPWRVLLLNRAIVATRTHDPDLMEAAYEDLGRLLPEDAPRFFEEGMRQMDVVGYPQPVREVMKRYYQRWTTAALH